jgi:hypothetical protein
MLRLRDGGILWGAIDSHDEQELAFRRLDNGGVVHLRWSLLDPEEERELRTRFGYLETGVDEILVTAEKVFLADGTERVGIVTERTPTELWLKSAEGRIPIPLQRLRGATTTVQVPALDIYTKDELYQQKVFELQAELLAGGERAARANFEVARFAEGLLDYSKALQHYQAAQRADPTFEADSLPAILVRAEEKAGLEEQVELLRQTDLWRARRVYPKALEGLAAFARLYPRSPLQADFEKLRALVAKYQERDLRETVVQSANRWARRLVDSAARKLPYQEAMTFLDGPMAEELLKKMQADLVAIAPEITPEEVRALWDERQGGRMQQASYGDGTWILGDGPARAEFQKEGETEKPEEGTKDEARQKLEEQVKRYLKNQEIAKRAQAGGDSKEEDPEAFWVEWPPASRAQWLLAYFVENAGFFRLENVRFRNCRECGGTGTRVIVYTGGVAAGASSQRVVPCATCHHIAVVRMVKYR